MKQILDHPALRLLAVFVLLQAFYWFIYHPNFVTPNLQPLPLIEVEAMEFSPVETPDAAGLADAAMEDYAPSLQTLAPGYYAARATFSLDQVPASGLAILPVARADNSSHFVNGQLVSSRGSMALDAISYRGNLTQIGQIPPAMLREGSNTISVIAAMDSEREALVVPALVADYDEAIRTRGWTEFLQSDFRIISLTMTIVLALLVGAVLLRSSERRFTFWLFVLLVSWSISTLVPIWGSNPIRGFARLWMFELSFVVMSASWPLMVDAWTRKPIRWFAPAILCVLAAMAALITYALLLQPGIFAAATLDNAIEYTGFAFTAAMIARLVWHFIRNPVEDRIWEGAALLLLAFFGVMFFYDVTIAQQNIGYLQKAQPVILLALTLSFFAARFHLFRSANQINTMLQTRLDQREAELEEVHTREKLWVRQQAFGEERQRIMRDMHDGLGSQLMGMLLAARRGKAEPDKVAEGLQQVIDELRLMIDSMDSVGESLGAALAALRTRLQPRVEDAGFAFAWDNRLADKLPSYPPRKTLQLFRIMQEAVTNALKHSGGTRIAITLEHAADQEGWLVVTVSDNGSGIKGPRIGGHGLENMRARAAQVGGTVSYDDPADGGTVRIAFPPSAPRVGDDA